MNAPRILLVDNRESHSDPVREYLGLNGYLVSVASQIQAAKELAEKFNPDLAVIDIRLIDETDDNDFSGLALAKELPAQMPKIILTAHPSHQAVREALGPVLNAGHPAAGFIAKQEGLPVLLQAIQLALAPPSGI